MADLSIIISSHNKPVLVKEALQSVLAQTHPNWEAVLMDSGVLLKQGFFDYLNDKRLTILPTNETPEMARTRNMAAWTFNHILASGRLTGELVMYLSDDDLLYPEAFKAFWDFYLQHNREPQAMYASQDIGLVDAQWKTSIIGRRIADRPAGRFCGGRRLDCRVDYLQFCHVRKVLERVEEKYKTKEFYPEAKRYSGRSDGIFLERVGRVTKIYNIDKVLSMNRRTAASVNLEYSDSRTGRFFILMKNKLTGISRYWDRQY